MLETADKLTVVIADDEPEMLEYVAHLLTRAGHRVAGIAATGLQLIEQHQQHSPDLIITDVRMRELDGIEAAKRCYIERPAAIIVISALDDPDLIERAMDAHVLAYLVKPIKATQLEPAIATAMRRFQEFQALNQDAAGPESSSSLHR